MEKLIKRNNSNLREHSDALWRELRKLRNIDGIDLCWDEYYYYTLIVGSAAYSDPMTEAEFRMDLDKFSSTLQGHKKEVFSLFRAGLSVCQISQTMGTPMPTTYHRVSKVIDLFKKFYTEGY